MAEDVEYRSSAVRGRGSAVVVLTFLLLATVALNWPSLYIHLYEKARIAADPHAYPFDMLGRQPDIIAAWWFIGFASRVPFLVTGVVLGGTARTPAALWRAAAIAGLTLAAFAFELAVSFYGRLW